MLPDYSAGGRTIVTFFLFDHENRVAIRRMEHRRGWNNQHLLLGRQDYGHVDIHAGTQLFIGVGQGGLHANIAGGGIHLRVYGRDFASYDPIRQGVRGYPDRETYADLAQQLLRQEKVDENWIERLQGYNSLTVLDNLAKIDLADPQSAGKRRANGFPGDQSPDIVGLG
ncbi:MAG: hypothetical protein ACD_75C02313G0005 [uncultured bacterium]|nr:MAG: hypothetical protein ACD_75C02313G0005 [uncultured bacterium]